MKLTRTIGLAGGIVGLGVIGYVIYLLLFKPASPPSDTPIVVGGGSVYGEIYNDTRDGWSPQPNNPKADHASLHKGGKNPYGTDYLQFMNFDLNPNNPTSPTNPGYSTTGTGGWALLVRNVLPGATPTPNPDTAVWLCSDAGCSAAAAGCQPTSFNPTGDVYFSVRANNAQLQSQPSSPVTTLNFHDTSTSCNSPTNNACDKVYDVALKTCNANGNTVLTLTCLTNPSACQVVVGTVLPSSPPK